jgi:hypothetical protein
MSGLPENRLQLSAAPCREAPQPSLYLDIPLEYRPAVGERAYFWPGRGLHGYATVREIRNHPRRGTIFYLDPEPNAHRGADYWVRSDGQSYWAPREHGVRLEQLEQPMRQWYRNF